MNTTTAQVSPGEQAPRPGAPNRIVPIVFGAIALLVALALLAGGGAAVWALGQRDASGYFTTHAHRVSTPSYAFASDSLDIGPDTPGGIGDFARVRIQATSARPVFIGIGRASDVARYLAQVDHAQVTPFDTDPFKLTEQRIAGTAEPSAPAGQNLWRVLASGTGTQTVSWPVEKGRWSAVVMNADGSRNVSIALRISARVSALKWVAIGLLTGGGLLLLIGGSLIYTGTRRQRPEATRVV
jgi:hypothetical protein